MRRQKKNLLNFFDFFLYTNRQRQHVFRIQSESSSAVGVSQAFCSLKCDPSKNFLALAKRSSVRSLRSGDSNRFQDIFLQTKKYLCPREFRFKKSGRRNFFFWKNCYHKNEVNFILFFAHTKMCMTRLDKRSISCR